MSNLAFIPVQGTGSPGPYDWGFPQDIANALSDPWADILAQFVGSDVGNIYDVHRTAYPAATVQMGSSVQVGRNVVRDIIRSLATGSKVVLSGYSQGALVTDFVIMDFYAGMFPGIELLCCVNFGDPMRSPGICRGNEVAGLPVPKKLNGFVTGGIAGPADLRPEQSDLVLSCNNDGDLYGVAPVGLTPWIAENGIGHDETLIFNLVQDFNGVNVLALAQEALTVLGMAATSFNLNTMITVVQSVIVGSLGDGGIPGIPTAGAQTPDHVVSIVLALLNGGMFVLSGFGPHGDYGKYVPAMVDHVITIGKAAYVAA